MLWDFWRRKVRRIYPADLTDRDGGWLSGSIESIRDTFIITKLAVLQR
jgi:hypothetical protein